MDLSLIPPSPMKGVLNLVVEIPAGSRNKYEYCSKAGIIPSRLQHNLNASRASVSLELTYFTLPMSLSQECSGPIPG